MHSSYCLIHIVSQERSVWAEVKLVHTSLQARPLQQGAGQDQGRREARSGGLVLKVGVPAVPAWLPERV